MTEINNIMHVIITAAGFSSRMGHPKGLVDWRGLPLLAHQLNIFTQIPALKPLVVMQPQQHHYETICSAYGTSIILNHHPERGMFYSLQLALQSIATTNGALLLPLDTPAPPVEFWQNFLHFIGHNGQTNITPSYQGKRGHPVFLASDLIKKINAQNWHQTESRLDYLLQHERQNHNVLDYPCQESLVVANINYPEDLKHQ